MADPITDSVSSELMRLIGEAEPHEFSLVGAAREAPYIAVRGWALYPFCDAGDLDYIDRVRTPGGTLYDVDTTTSEDGARWVGSVDGSLATGDLFNWSPPLGLVPWDKCPCGYRTCWSNAYMGA